MLTVLLVVQIIIAVAMGIVILIQRSASDGLTGLGGGGGNSLMSGRASANLLTKTTAFLAAAFMINSLAMATITARSANKADSIIEKMSSEPAAPAEVEQNTEPAVPNAE